MNAFGLLSAGRRERRRLAVTTFSVLALAMTGCGAASRMPRLSKYQPPLTVPPGALTVKPKSAQSAQRALRTIASTMHAPQFSNRPVRFGLVQYQLIISNAGSPNAFTLDQSVADEVTVMPDSSARMREEVLTSPRFLSRRDRLRWEATGRHPYASPADHAGQSSRSDIPPGGFTFTPHGRSVTFKRARALPTTPRALRKNLARLLGPTGGSIAAAAMSLRQYGFLLASAPLRPAARQALLEAMAALPGVHICSALFPTSHRHREAFCVDGNPTSTNVLINRRTGVAIVVSERVNRPTPLYPNFATGTLVDSYTFTPQSPTS